MSKKLDKLTDKYYKIQQEIADEMSKLKNYGGDCDCSNSETFRIIHHGNWDEIVEYCIDCGGMSK